MKKKLHTMIEKFTKRPTLSGSSSTDRNAISKLARSSSSTTRSTPRIGGVVNGTPQFTRNSQEKLSDSERTYA